MSDRGWCEEIEARVKSLESRMNKLLETLPICSNKKNVIELEIEWPAAFFMGLFFNKQFTRAVFEKEDDYSFSGCEILFYSARNMDGCSGHDALTEYLESEPVKIAFLKALKKEGVYAEQVKIYLPVKNNGVKKYNGVNGRYWLKPCYVDCLSDFHCISPQGTEEVSNSSFIQGVAPSFCIDRNGHK